MTLEIAVSIPPLSDNNLGMLRGVIEYVRHQPDLRVFKIGAVPFVPLAQLKNWTGAGAICAAETADELQRLVELKIPRVSVSLHQRPPKGLPTVHSDNQAIGQLAAKHLRSLGLSRFVFVGYPGWEHNVQRLAGFRNELKSEGFDCEVVEVSFVGKRKARTATADLKRHSLRQQLKALTFPSGLFAAHDEFSHDVVETLRALNVRVPYDTAVIGVNNYRLVCETSEPPLSSIAQSSHKIGFNAAQTLHGMLKGEKPPRIPILLPPAGLIARRSSDYSAVDDPLVIQAMDFIRKHCGEPITAEDVVEDSSVARRTLDKRFTNSIGHPISEELRLSRIKKARELLVSTDMRVLKIGLLCGYDSPSGFVRAFREATGQTPHKFRQNSRNL